MLLFALYKSDVYLHQENVLDLDLTLLKVLNNYSLEWSEPKGHPHFNSTLYSGLSCVGLKALSCISSSCSLEDNVHGGNNYLILT